MRVIAQVFVLLLFFFTLSLLVTPQKVFADNDTQGAECTITVAGTTSSSVATGSLPISAPTSQTSSDNVYQIRWCGDLSSVSGKSVVVAVNRWGDLGWTSFNLAVDSSDSTCLIGNITANNSLTDSYSLDIQLADALSTPICKRRFVKLLGMSQVSLADWNSSLQQLCSSFNVVPATGISTNNPITSMFSLPTILLPIQPTVPRGAYDPNGNITAFYYVLQSVSGTQSNDVISQQILTQINSINNGTLSQGAYKASIRMNTVDINGCVRSFCVGSPTKPWNPGDACETVTGGAGGTTQASFALCEQAAPADKGACIACFGGGAGSATTSDKNAPTKLWTAFGCINTSRDGIIKDLLRIGLGISGGFVLLTILYGSFLLTTSSGDPKRVQEGQEMVTSAIMGLFFVIFSIIILRFIGVSILQIPGFGN